jgi:The  BURPS668_1122 family of deaminases
LSGTPGSIKSSATGELKIISENPYCVSCSGIIQQFNEMYPNVKLILIDGTK